ncbi:unnamed protein product [Ixodes pacificus]
MPAWSQPGFHSVVRPFMRCLRARHRVTQSSTATVRACPKCKLPVTLGGGMTITKRPLGLVNGPHNRQLTPYSGLKNWLFSHQACQAASTCWGLYASGMGPEVQISPFFSPGAVGLS